ncbi:MAG: hypothetical protein ACC654_07715 [Acidimicrobiia bacterium]
MITRVFFDSSVLSAAHALSEEWPSIVYPGHPDWPLKQDAADEVWLAHVGQLGWVAVFRDKRIRYRPAERDALKRHAVRAVSITTNRNLRIADQATLIGRQMPKIEALAGKPAAYYTLNASGLTQKFAY